VTAAYKIDPRYDPDLLESADQGGEQAVAAALAVVCACGHTRAEHMGATGALASFGGTACEKCWTCPTFTAARA
jgi:hypothetical protein